MVAVAMGLLGPAAVASDEHLEDATKEVQECAEEEILAALESEDAPVWSQLTLQND